MSEVETIWLVVFLLGAAAVGLVLYAAVLVVVKIRNNRRLVAQREVAILKALVGAQGELNRTRQQ